MENTIVLGAAEGNIGEAIAAKMELMGLSPIVPERAALNALDEKELRDFLRQHNPAWVVWSVGFNMLAWSHEVEVEEWQEIMLTNSWGFLLLMRELQALGGTLPRSVVALSSDAARRPMRTSAAYCASKAALDMTIRVTARELAPVGWRVNGVAPGKVADTPMTRYVDEQVLEIRGWTREYADAYELASAPHGRMVTRAEVADVVCDVLFSTAQSFTGQVVEVNGGR